MEKQNGSHDQSGVMFARQCNEKQALSSSGPQAVNKCESTQVVNKRTDTQTVMLQENGEKCVNRGRLSLPKRHVCQKCAHNYFCLVVTILKRKKNKTKKAGPRYFNLSCVFDVISSARWKSLISALDLCFAGSHSSLP